MPVIIPKDIKTNVIQEWLAGKNRDAIATRYDISAGTVSNIVYEWRDYLGAYTADSIRDLAVALRKTKLTPARCAIGFRISRLMQKIGVLEEDFEYFLSEIYNKCESLEISADDIADYLIEIIKISNIVFPSKIPEYIEKKKEEIKILDQEYKEKKQKLKELEAETSKCENRFGKLLETEKISVETIEWYNGIMEKLEKIGIPIKDIDFFVKCVDGIKNLNYDAEKVISKYSDYQFFKLLIEMQKKSHENKKKDIEALEFQIRSLKEQVNMYGLKISNLDSLEYLGFGIDQLRHLYNIVSEVAIENNINSSTAIKKFFEDLKDYDRIMGFNDMIKKQVEENNNLNIQIATARNILTNQKYTGPIIENLLKKGITEKDIADINAIVSFTEKSYFGKNDLMQSLIQDLNKYRSIKQATVLVENSKKDLEKQNIILERQKSNNEANLYFIWLFWLTALRESQKFKYFTENPTQIYLLYTVNNNNKNTASNLSEKDKEQNDDDSIEDNQYPTKID